MTLRLRLASTARWSFGIIVLVMFSYAIGRFTLDPATIRTLLFSALLLLAVGLSMRNPASAMFLLILYVPFLGLLRRILIPVAGWSSLDPLVLLEPVVILLLASYWFYRRYFLYQTTGTDTRIFSLLRWMILVDVIEVFNPKQGSLTVGFGGVIFYVVPLFWMIVSREHFNWKWMRYVVGVSFTIGIVVALYGLKQTYFGFYGFEKDWISLVSISSLNVNGVIRAVSTMTNSQEYAEYLGLAMVFGLFYVLRGRWYSKVFGLVGMSLMGWAMFMESVRGTIVTTLLALSVMTIMNARKIRTRLVMLVLLSGVLTSVFVGLKHIHSTNGLVTHSVVGLTQPLGKHSTLSSHASMMMNGIMKGIKMPIGYGLGSTTTAAGKFSSDNATTEVDISNMFVSDGVLGGGLFLLLMGTIIYQALRRAHFGSKLGLIAVGVLCATAGQWVNGGLYSVAALVWIVVGQLDREVALSPARQRGIRSCVRNRSHQETK